MTVLRSTDGSLRLLGAGKAFRTELLAMLEEVDLVADLEWREIELLAPYMAAYQAKPGCVLFREGEPGTYMCLLVAGQVTIAKQALIGDAPPVEVSSERRGRSIGEMALIDGEPRSATCSASTPATLLVLTRENFLTLAAQHPQLGFRLLLRIAKLVSRRLRQASGRLIDLM